MISLKDFFNLKKKYIAIHFTKETEEALRNYALSNNFDLTKNYNGDNIEPREFKFHTTVFFTDKPHPISNKTIKVDGEASVKSIELLGKNKDIPVLKLDTGFNHIRKQFEELGLSDEWPEYKPHVTLSYQYKSINNLKLPEFKIVADHIIIEDQE